VGKNIEMNEVLIIGGLGFIGSNLACRLVKEGSKVTILDAELDPYGWNHFNIKPIIDKIKYIKGDIRDKNLINNLVKRKNLIFNFAGQVSRLISIENPYLDIDININGSINLLESVREFSPGAKVIFAGSRGQTGEPEYLPVDEKHPDNPTDIYGINKLAAEKYHKIYNDIYDVKTTTFRINNVYGPKCQIKHGHYGVLNLFIYKALIGEPLTVYGTGNQTRDYIYIDDLIDAFLKVIDNPQTNGHFYQIGSGKETKFMDMVELILINTEHSKAKHIPFPKILDIIDIDRYVSNISKIKNDAKWVPKVSLKTGIQRTIQYYKKYLDQYL
jgi:UDP-glucose 4-epimerase